MGNIRLTKEKSKQEKAVLSSQLSFEFAVDQLIKHTVTVLFMGLLP